MTIEAAAESIALDCHTHMVPVSDLDVSMLSKIAKEAFEKVLKSHNMKPIQTKPTGGKVNMENQILQGVNKIVKEFEEKRMNQHQRKLV